MAAEREEFFWANEERYAQRRRILPLLERTADEALRHLRRQIPDPGLVERLTPDHTLGCKRVLKSDDYYPTFNLPHVRLETSGIARAVEDGVVTEDGTVHPLDVIVMCTGFEATDLPIAHRVFGRDGLALSEHWSDGMRAYATTAVHGFPNLWMINGPNTGLGHNSSVYMTEVQIDHIMGALTHMASSGTGVLEVTSKAETEFADHVDRLSQGTVWLDGSCSSWYVDPRSGRLTTLWPDSAYRYRQTNAGFDPTAYARVSEAAR